MLDITRGPKSGTVRSSRDLHKRAVEVRAYRGDCEDAPALVLVRREGGVGVVLDLTPGQALVLASALLRAAHDAWEL